mmetsp:Transcript_11371/g.17442  ORF Transcript_11371/g.17442 Transcript_11371/m.17442 type:complete len:1263 (-) Transcript_11371:420-4208(-)
MLAHVIYLVYFLYVVTNGCLAEQISLKTHDKSTILYLSEFHTASGFVQDPEEKIFARIAKFPRAGLLHQYYESEGENTIRDLMGVSNISPAVRVFSWANKVGRFSSQFSSCGSDCSSWNNPACKCEEEGWAASQILGPPDAFPDYARSELAWTPSLEDNGDEFIELEFPFEMYVDGTELYEIFNPGAVRKISTMANYTDDIFARCPKFDVTECSRDLKWQELWTKSEIQNSSIVVKKATIFSPKLCPSTRKTKVLRIDLDTSKSPGWNALDAVKLVGTLELPSGFVKDDQNRLEYFIRDGIHGEDEVLVTFSDCSSQVGETSLTVDIEPPASGSFSSSVFHEEDVFLFHQAKEAMEVPINLYPVIDEIHEVLGVNGTNLRGLFWHTDAGEVELETEFFDVSILEPEINIYMRADRTSKVELWLADSSSSLTFRVHYNLFPCSSGETTDEIDMEIQSINGREFCVIKDNNLLPIGLILFGYIVTAFSWGLSILFLCWIYKYRRENPVKCSQIEFLVLICMGTIISSSTVVALSFEAKSESETTAASMACKVAPFLYTAGWVLQYSSLCAKTWRIFKVMRSFKDKDVRRVTFYSVLPYVLLALFVDLLLVTILAVFNPLEYVREDRYDVDAESKLITVESVGKCTTIEDTPSFWTIAGPLIGFHLFLILLTNILLLKVRNLKDIYQESKYFVMAMGLVFEFLIVALPVFASIQDSNIIRYSLCIVFIGIHDISILCFFFIPKILWQRRGGTREKNDLEESFVLQSLQREELTRNVRDTKSDIDTVAVYSEESAPTHIPSRLGNIIMSKRTSQTTVRFVLKEFGGVDDSDGMGTIASPAKRFVAYEDEKLYILPEFQRAKKKMQLCKMLSWTSLKKWDFNVFELTKLGGGKNPLLFMSWAILCSPYSQYSMAKACGIEDASLDDFRGYDFIDSDLKIPIRTLCDYFRVIENDYNSDIPFHNQIHAADVLQSLHALIQMANGSLNATKEQLFSVLLAAVIHDVNHPGRNNAFQTNARTRLALLYNDCSILEHRHLSHAFRRMLGMHTDNPDSRVRNDELNFLRNVPLKRFLTVRTRIIECVLKTDMSKHFETVNVIKELMTSRKDGEKFSEEASWVILQYVLHVADISNAAKGEPLFKLWTERCLNEFFDQGDVEADMGLPISPNCDRKTTDASDCQVGFIHFILIPSFKLLGQIIPRVEKQIVPILRKNLEYWKRLQDPTLEANSEPESVSSEESFDADGSYEAGLFQVGESPSLSDTSLERLFV